MELAKVMHRSILEAVIPQEVMEEVGRAIVAETEWSKLTPRSKVALFRVAGILQEKLPKVEIPLVPTNSTETATKTPLVTDVLDEEK